MKRVVILFLAALVTVPAFSETVVVAASLSAESEHPIANRYLRILEGAVMGPFFDAGHIVFNSPLPEADLEALGASVMLVLVLEVPAVDGVPTGGPSSVHFALRTADLKESFSGDIDLNAVDPALTFDERSSQLGHLAAASALRKLGEW